MSICMHCKFWFYYLLKLSLLGVCWWMYELRFSGCSTLGVFMIELKCCFLLVWLLTNHLPATQLNMMWLPVWLLYINCLSSFICLIQSSIQRLFKTTFWAAFSMTLFSLHWMTILRNLLTISLLTSMLFMLFKILTIFKAKTMFLRLEPF